MTDSAHVHLLTKALALYVVVDLRDEACEGGRGRSRCGGFIHSSACR